MAKQQTTWIIIIAIALVAIFVLPKMGLFAATGNEQLIRSAPTQVTPGQVFTVTYTPSGTPTGNWFVAWEDTATGGCQPAKYQAFLANGGTGSTTFTAPQSGSCTLTGFYQFTGMNQVNLPSLTINVCQPKTLIDLGKQCGSYSDTCGGTISGSCLTGQQCSSTGQCITCKTAADINCDTSISLQEMIDYANKWVNNQGVTFQQLIDVANAWAG